MFEESFIRLLMLDGREMSASCIYCSGIFDLKEAVRNGWYNLLLGIMRFLRIGMYSGFLDGVAVK